MWGGLAAMRRSCRRGRTLTRAAVALPDTMDGLNVSFWQGGLTAGKGLALEAQSMGRRNVPEGERL